MPVARPQTAFGNAIHSARRHAADGSGFIFGIAERSTPWRRSARGSAGWIAPQGRIDGNGDMARHPDGQVGHDPPGAILGKDARRGSRAPTAALSDTPPCGGTPGRPAPKSSRAPAHRRGLCQENTVGSLALPSINALQQQIVVSDAHGSLPFRNHSTFTAAAGAPPARAAAGCTCVLTYPWVRYQLPAAGVKIPRRPAHEEGCRRAIAALESVRRPSTRS